MSGGDGSAEAAGKLGMFFAIIGGLAGYGANQGGGAIMGAIAGFALGVAVVRAVKYAAIVIVGGLGLLLAVASITTSWKNVQAAGTPPSSEEATSSDTTGATDASAQVDAAMNAARNTSQSTDGTKKIWVSNRCSQSIKIYIKWQAPDEGWHVNGPWDVANGDSKFLAFSDGSYAMTVGTDFYFYAEAPEAGLAWGGSENVAYEGRTLPMQNADPVITEPSYDLKLVCDS